MGEFSLPANFNKRLIAGTLENKCGENWRSFKARQSKSSEAANQADFAQNYGKLDER